MKERLFVRDAGFKKQNIAEIPGLVRAAQQLS